MEKLTEKNRRAKIEFVRLASVRASDFHFSTEQIHLLKPLRSAADRRPREHRRRPVKLRPSVSLSQARIFRRRRRPANPVDTYRTEDIQKLGVMNQTDLLNKLPIEAGGTVNQNIANGGDGAVTPNLRGLLPKETLVLVDGKRVAPNANGIGVDINLIPFPMIDRIEILKDGASVIMEPTRLRVCSTSF